jgi:hypothetical protein
LIDFTSIPSLYEAYSYQALLCCKQWFNLITISIASSKETEKNHFLSYRKEKKKTTDNESIFNTHTEQFRRAIAEEREGYEVGPS